MAEVVSIPRVKLGPGGEVDTTSGGADPITGSQAYGQTRQTSAHPQTSENDVSSLKSTIDVLERNLAILEQSLAAMEAELNQYSEERDRLTQLALRAQAAAASVRK